MPSLLNLSRRSLMASTCALVATPSVSLAKPKPSVTADGNTALIRDLYAVPDLAPRRRTRFDTGWRFAFGHLYDPSKDFDFGKDQRTFAKQGPDATSASPLDFDESGWRPVSLPHDWAVELPFVPSHFTSDKPADDMAAWDEKAEHGYKPIGREFPETSVGWYRKTFSLDAAISARQVSLEFDGIFRGATVIVNGYIVKTHDSGYTPFRVALNDFLTTDGTPNTLLVRVDASLGEGWFYEGAGIYRHVWLVVTDAVHIPQYGVCIRAQVDGQVEVTTTLRNDSGQTRKVALGSHIMDVKAAEAFSQVELAAWSEQIVTHRVAIAQPRLWDLDAPNLYEVTSEIVDNGVVIDKAVTRFGIRSIRFDSDQGFFLNDRPVKILGTCNHQDHAGVGVALPDALQVWRLQQLKDMGCNAYRTSHNPPTPELLEACDAMGILVIDETRMMTSSDEGLEQLKTLIVRDRNHPSVILWSIGNEEQSQQGTERGAKIARTMKRLINQLDPTRQITAAMDHGHGEGITEVLDVIGFNYHDKDIDGFHAKFPSIPIIGTETASTVATRGEYSRDVTAHLVPAYDTDAPYWATTAEGWWPHFDAKPYICGGFIWTGFDYRGEPTPFNSFPSISSQFGVLDTCGFPKDNYYYYRAWWRSEPLLHLFPHWNWEGREGQTIPVWVHSNADEVELFVNGVSAGKKTVVKDRHLEWKVVYRPGKIEAFAFKGGKPILKARRETAGPAHHIALTCDRTTLLADGADTAVIKVAIVDAAGRPVPKASDLVTFAIEGAGSLIGVGNGNPNSLEADKANARKAFNGLCCAIVQSGLKSDDLTILASSPGLKDGHLKLSLKPQ